MIQRFLQHSSPVTQPFAISDHTLKKNVTCGGISLNEISFKTMESKIIPNCFFAGEILDVDGITGGFNFQNAWTTGFIAATGMLACDGDFHDAKAS